LKSQTIKALLLNSTVATSLLLGAVCSPIVYADNTIPVADFYKKASFSGRPILSPDGKNLAVLVPRDGKSVLAIINMETRKPTVVASDPNYNVSGPTWINNRRLIFSVTKGSEVTASENDGGGLFAVDLDGTNFKTLMGTAKARQGGEKYKSYGVVARVGNNSDDLIVIDNSRGLSSELGATDLHLLDTKSGRTKLLTFKNPGKVGSWDVDHNNVIRVATSHEFESNTNRIKQTVYYRENENDEWKVIYTAYPDEGKDMSVLGFDFDNKTMFVSGRFNGKDTQAIHIWDFKTQSAGELILDAPGVDVSTLLQDFEQKKTYGAVITGMKDEYVYFDEAYAKIQASLNASFPNEDVYFSLRGNRAIVTTSSVNNVGTVYFYDTQQQTLEKIYSVKPEFEGKKLSEQKVINYSARDGLNIPAYLTLPEGMPAKKLPLIAYIHGGPHARDGFGYDPTTQMFASRGYAVLQPQFRMSTGFGWKHHTAGWKQWGLAMQDDITDGVKALIDQGIVDKDRVCIIGASYGGYATMYGLIKDPDFYQCGINFVGVTDVKMLFTVTWSDTAGGPVMKNMGRLMHGDPKTDQAYFDKASALVHADKIKKPVLMAYGSEDIRVPLIHGEKMRDKLLAQGNTVDWMVMVGEGHGWAKESNNILWGETILNFVNRYIGDGAQKSKANK
jgi:dipeptidyl aminopeptidase/acylaminoacyl peptidase